MKSRVRLSSHGFFSFEHMVITWLLLFWHGIHAERRIQVEIYGLHEGRGSVRLALYQSSAQFLKKDGELHHELQKTPDADFCTFMLTVPAGQYALAVFQDENEDGFLNKNILGIPTEPYGFSNDAMGLIGPPSFKDAKVEVSDQEKIRIHLR